MGFYSTKIGNKWWNQIYSIIPDDRLIILLVNNFFRMLLKYRNIEAFYTLWSVRIPRAKLNPVKKPPVSKILSKISATIY